MIPVNMLNSYCLGNDANIHQTVLADVYNILEKKNESCYGMEKGEK